MGINSEINLNLLIYPKKNLLTESVFKSYRGGISEDCIRQVVGATGFEPATARPPGVCATGLRYAPTLIIIEYVFCKRVKLCEQFA